MKIKKIEKHKIEPTWDIEVENVHSYILSSGIVSHNSKVSNSTPGVEPPRKLLIVKEDKAQVTKQVVPDYYKYRNFYTTAWSPEMNNIDYFSSIAIIQKFSDQSISTNQFSDLTQYDEGKYPFDRLEKEIFHAYKLGYKTLYYQTFRTGNDSAFDDVKETEGCGSGGCII